MKLRFALIFLIAIMAFLAIRNFSAQRTVENKSYEPPPAKKSLAQPKKVKTSSSASAGITQPTRRKTYPEANKLPAPPTPKPAHKKAPDPSYLTKEQFFKKYSKVLLEKLLKNSKNYHFVPQEDPLVTEAVKRIIKCMVGGNNFNWAYAVSGDLEHGSISSDSCISFQWKEKKVIGIYGNGSLKFYQTPLKDAFIADLKDKYYFLLYGKNLLHQEFGDDALILFYAKNNLGKIIYQDRLDKGLFISSPSTVSNFEFCRNVFKHP